MSYWPLYRVRVLEIVFGTLSAMLRLKAFDFMDLFIIMGLF